MNPTRAHCNSCGGERNHDVLHSAETSWSDDESGIGGKDRYDTLKCLGCDSIKLRHTSWFSEDPDPVITYIPPAIFRPKPDWFSDLVLNAGRENKFVEKLLEEIYVALHYDLPSLAAMGVRSLIEKIMISKTGDQGTFVKNLKKFEELGYVSRIERERLETILEAGHATIHRDFSPESPDIITLVDIAEHIVQSVYLHDSKIEALKKRVPPRKIEP
jgi:DNA-binding MarR family transcriptional regulator